MRAMFGGMRCLRGRQSVRGYAQLGHEDNHFNPGDYRHLLFASCCPLHLALQPHQGIEFHLTAALYNENTNVFKDKS